MRRRVPLDERVRVVLFALTAALVASAFAVRMPGLPPTLKADEPAYFLGALSLALDGDFECEPRDLERAFDAFPYLPVQNLILASDDGWKTVTFGKPWLYPALAAPFAALGGAPGMVAFNMLLLAGGIWLGTLHLRRWNPDSLAALVAAGFYLGSHVWAYAFWLHPEMLILVSVATSLHFGLESRHGRTRRADLPLVVSGVALAVAAYHKPMLVAFGLPIGIGLLLERRVRPLVVWTLAGVVSMAAFGAGSVALTGHPTAYLDVERGGFTVRDPSVLPTAGLGAATVARERASAESAPSEGEVPPEAEPSETTPPAIATEEAELGERSAGWWWILHLPEVDLRELREDLFLFLFGRHTGLVPYQPFAVLALVAFLAGARRSIRRWVLLGALALVAGFLLLFIPFNWHGGGGFVGNRYFVLAAPAFLYLMREVRPRLAIPAAWVLAAALVGGLWWSGYGVPVSWPTLQSHVRRAPFELFPFELALKEMPGYDGAVVDELWIRGRRDEARFAGREVWVRGAQPVELFAQSAAPLRELVLEVSSPVAGNEVRLEVDGEVRIVRAGPEPVEVRWSFEEDGDRRWDRDPADVYRVIPFFVRRLRVRAETGEVPAWRGSDGPVFYVGARLRVGATEIGVSQSPAGSRAGTDGANER